MSVEGTSSPTTASPDALAGALPWQRLPGHDIRPMTSGALIEQAKGVLVFRYSIDADTALSILELWSSEVGADLAAVAFALINDICQGGESAPRSDARLVRALEERLRRDRPHVDLAVTSEPVPVVVGMDQSYSAMPALVAGARQAARLGVPLEIRYDEERTPLSRAHLMQRVDLAVELARAVEPGVVVRLSQVPRTKPKAT
jgi:hypothetical protein